MPSSPSKRASSPVGRLVVPDAEPVEAGRDQRFGRAGIDLVAGQLLADESVVRLIAIERGDHVVAISPGEGLGRVALVAVGLAVANQVEPVPAPFFAIMRAGEQAVDQALERAGRSVGDERVDLVRGRRQPGEVICQPADQGRAIRGRGRLESLGFEPRQDERVNRRAAPVSPFDARNRGPAHRAKRPAVAPARAWPGECLPGRSLARSAAGAEVSRRIRRPRQALLDPAREHLDFARRQLARRAASRARRS